MKVDIWSDIRCPFCYIGKRKFENALENFPHKKDVEVIWHSFQLDPNLQTQPEKDTIDYFTEVKGVSREQALQMFNGAKKMAEESGIELKPETSVLANSEKSHQLLQFAKTKSLGNEMKEALFIAHFKEAKNIDDIDTLVEIANVVGLDKAETKEVLTSGKFLQAVKQDELAAQKIGVRGVPFFVFSNKYGVSGAQAEETFLEILQKTWEETEEPKLSYY
ncbi:DsbA family oxidoreductase [Antarcticibacterium sp. 1MA-6-2]|uniref:DsbA family oxidoreductase n=1 Tax=Antarcticibacterium sp. 1MA-6-2 TaxID=2908210 RepID=UPI001F3D7DF1|nr:DsbA family oxidoreductase [Antarcticibacterium sp. 1MA-6-2]UJH91210.1 DsbA family oxidoreductase [Antarcticibacterium sp. 1MA-6-2]